MRKLSLPSLLAEAVLLRRRGEAMQKAVPVGVGAMYIKADRLGDIDRMLGDDGPLDRIESRMHTGTANFATYLSVPAALDFHDAVGAAYKAARVRYLRDRWVAAVRNTPGIEILTPDFRGKGRVERALAALAEAPPDVFNHNIETVPRLYKEARPGSDYRFSLNLLKKFKALFPQVPTKSGLMVGLGETDDEILQVMRDMRAHGIDMLTIGQYLAPSQHHLPVRRYVPPETFAELAARGRDMGFANVASGPLVRSSYHADLQAAGHAVA